VIQDRATKLQPRPGDVMARPLEGHLLRKMPRHFRAGPSRRETGCQALHEADWNALNVKAPVVKTVRRMPATDGHEALLVWLEQERRFQGRDFQVTGPGGCEGTGPPNQECDPIPRQVFCKRKDEVKGLWLRVGKLALVGRDFAPELCLEVPLQAVAVKEFTALIRGPELHASFSWEENGAPSNRSLVLDTGQLGPCKDALFRPDPPSTQPATPETNAAPPGAAP
jgi:hypothetical protein